jgi:ubiquinone/menaquinone biosynthesis C-methylase UbiE
MQKKDKYIGELLKTEDDSVKEHYEKWPFPDLSFTGREGLVFLRYLHEVLHKDVSAGKKVIDIGCGTGHGTIAVASHFPRVQFIGLDLSTASIQKANETAKENRLSNIEFIHGDVRDRSTLPAGLFDLAISAGVLHHIENVARAFANLSGLLRDNGVIIMWLYGRHGRIRHSLNQAFINMLTRNKSLDDREKIAGEFVSQLGGQYAVDSGFYTPRGSGTDGLEWLLSHKQWLTDQMIPPYEHCYTMKEILSLFREHGFRFRKWLGVSTRLESHTSSALLLEEFNQLASEERLLAIDCLIKPEYYFVSGQKELR